MKSFGFLTLPDSTHRMRVILLIFRCLATSAEVKTWTQSNLKSVRLRSCLAEGLKIPDIVIVDARKVESASKR